VAPVCHPGRLTASPGWERLAFELAALGRATVRARALVLWTASERISELLAVSLA
jgi:hypothetical protein